MPRGKVKPKTMTFPNSIIHMRGIAAFVFEMVRNNQEEFQQDLYLWLKLAVDMPPEKLKKKLNDCGIYYRKGLWQKR